MRLIIGVALFCVSVNANEGALSWAWNDQLKPTIDASWSSDGKLILGTTAGLTILANAYDKNIYDHNERKENLLFSDQTAKDLGVAGSGMLGIGIAVGQLIWDQKEGLAHARAIFLTSVSHVTLAFLFQRGRPGNRDDFLPFKSSFPSGHASSAFATATSLHLSYGLDVGIPAYLVASSISLARVSENTHWLSDAVAGTGLGIFWALASHKVKVPVNNYSLAPMILPDGMGAMAKITY
ncbi:MAG: phosphatase PAP2 family protein [Bacteriovoracaceae bacterium]|nr:phosphatase PAP2 family protein [Bacteriovoracaceae bacterium]